MAEAAGSSGRWIEVLRGVPRARARLVIFHYAGGSAAAFRPWVELLHPDAEIKALQLPGRERRARESLTHHMSEIVESVIRELGSADGIPTAFYGHSIGGLMAFEVAHALREGGQLLPQHLVITGRRAPHLAPPTIALHRLPDAQFIEALSKYDGTPESVIGDRELMRFYLPRLRSDFAISENYVFVPRELLQCPITAIAGDTDNEADVESVFQWRYQTRAAFEFRRMRGGHFFIHRERQAVVAAIDQVLRQLMSSEATVSH